jgi:hypothetical protein
MKTSISGASGFTGGKLSTHFRKQGHGIIPIGRADFNDGEKLKAKLSEADVVINLAGAPISGRWSKNYKKKLMDSRVLTTRKIVRLLNEQEQKPLLISASAVGIYADGKRQDEQSRDYASNYLSQICQSWEKEARQYTGRTVIFRFGVVLAADGGAYPLMARPFRWFVGGRLGHGHQGFSFIHIADFLRAFDHVINNNRSKGIYNLCSPVPTDNRSLTRQLARALKRPVLFPVPGIVLRLLFSDGAQVFLDGQKAIPKRLLDEGFLFEYGKIGKALENIEKKQG